MVFIKKIFLLNVAVIPPVFLINKYLILSKNEISKDQILKTYSKNIFQNIPLDEKIDNNLKNTKNKFIYSLFSLNLTTFSKLLNQYFYQWFLFKWADELLKDKSDSFLNSKINVFNELKKHNSEYNPPKKSLNPKNWNKNNSIIFLSQKILQEEFEKIFFKKLFLKKDAEENVTFGLDEEEKKLGGEKYKEVIFNFQNFLYSQWIEKEKPFLICKNSWKYDNSKSEIFSDDSDLKIPEQGNFNFPSFKKDDKTWKSFIENIKKNENVNFCEDKEAFLYTTEQLTHISDGYKLSALIHNNQLTTKKPKNKPINKITNDEIKDENHKINPIYFFLKKSESGEKTTDETRKLLWKIDKNVFKQNGDHSEFKEYESVSHLVDIEIKKNGQNARAKRNLEQAEENKIYGTISRTQDGIVFFLKKPEHIKIKDFLLKNQKDILDKEVKNKDNKKIPDFKLNEILKKFFKNNSGILIAKYLHENSNNFLLKEHKSIAENAVLINSALYLEELEKNQRYSKIISIFSKTSEKYANFTFKKNNEEYLPEKSAGLATPILFQKNLNMLHSDTKIELKDIYSDNDQTETIREYLNDGNIPELTEDVFGKLFKTQLHKNAKNLKTSIAYLEITKNINKKTDLDSYFLDDYIFDNIFYDMKHNKELFNQTIKSIALLNEIKFDLFLNKISDYSKNIFHGKNEKIARLIEEYILEEYYAKEYLNEENFVRINYGGYEYKKLKKNIENNEENNENNCIQKTSKNQNSIIDEIDENNNNQECKNFLIENKKIWREKVWNYWIEKNYFLNDYAYEISSQTTTKYLKFLQSLSWSTKNNFENIKKFFKNKIFQGHFGAFVWINEIKDSDWKPNGNQDEQKYIGKEKEENDIKILENNEKYFREKITDDFIFNPYFSSEIKLEDLEKGELPAIGNYSKAFATTSENKYSEFNGFKGFITEDFNKNKIPENLISVIFKNFSLSNPLNNKSFLEKNKINDSSNKKQYGTHFGNIFSEKNCQLNEKINSIKTISEIEKYINELPDEIKNTYKSENNIEKKYSLAEKKNKLMEMLSKIQKDQDLISFSRFSGYLQDPNSHDSIYQQKYFIPKENSSKEGYIIYITQLKKSDFDEQFKNLFSEISVRTFLKSIFISSESEEIKNIAEKNTLTQAGLFL